MMKIAISGLGRMGNQIARKLIESKVTVIVHNRSSEPIIELAAQGAIPAFSREELIKNFSDQQTIIWLMLPAPVVASELEEWLAILPTGSIIIDGGNSDYRDTRERAQLVSSRGMSLVDVGTSGGIWGYQNGFSMMVGGDTKAYTIIEPFLKILAAPGGDYKFFGAPGAGHYVKMVHNAIEYGIMESLAEGYHLLHEGPYQNLNLADAGEVWQHHSVITSWLNELSRDIVKNNPNLNGIDGFVAESGETRFALETAAQYHIPMPAIQAAFQVRLESQKGNVNFATKLLAAMRNAFGGHKINK